MTPVARPEHQRPRARRARRARRTRELHLPPGRHLRIDRHRARPYHGHGRHRFGSLPATVAKRRRGGIPHVQGGRPKSWPARAQPGSNNVKEHGRNPGRDAQEVRPSTGRATHTFARIPGGLCRTRPLARVAAGQRPGPGVFLHNPPAAGNSISRAIRRIASYWPQASSRLGRLPGHGPTRVISRTALYRRRERRVDVT